ncbi:MAG: hypothetical protein RIF41_26470 [Polyangiaceae bacterium]
MARLWVARLSAFGAVALWLAACGARSQLTAGDGEAGLGGSGVGGEGGSEPEPEPCEGMEQQACGSDVGECSPGIQICQADGFFGECLDTVGPFEEACNDLDDDCDGVIDNGFGIGEACDGPDNDECLDDVMTCDGCTLGDDILEVCNGVDDNCNGEVDADCDVGDCAPSLLVTGSVPSDPNCINLPVEAGSSGQINYPCEGGMVTATLDAVSFSGTVSSNGQVALFGSEQVIGPDNCLWQLDHSITGSLPSGTVQYFYEETLLTMPQGNCWFPCTETGTVDIDWEG